MTDLTCPACQQHVFEVSWDNLGETVSCLICGARFTVQCDETYTEEDGEEYEFWYLEEVKE